MCVEILNDAHHKQTSGADSWIAVYVCDHLSYDDLSPDESCLCAFSLLLPLSYDHCAIDCAGGK